MIEATVIRDSISDYGVRLVTMKLRYPKMIHGEFMTHRVFSRNASSSRAVPTAKLLAEVRSRELRAAPVSWGQNQKGMQAGGELSGDTLDEVQRCWAHAAYDAAYHAERMMNRGAHKQVVNRLLEPFSHINVIVTATEWMNFFGLRLDAAAQPEMRCLAEAMWRAFNESVPLRLGHGQWHLPFVDDEDIEWLEDYCSFHDGGDEEKVSYSQDVMEEAIKVSVARCARVSYESFESGKRSKLTEDIALHDRLLESHHLSPFEHIATPDLKENGVWEDVSKHGNFVGWIQHRKSVLNESIMPLPEAYKI